MFKQSKDNKNCYNFKVGSKTIEVFFSEDDEQSEVYELENPKNGMIFPNNKHLISFVNNLTDVVEHQVGE